MDTFCSLSIQCAIIDDACTVRLRRALTHTQTCHPLISSSSWAVALLVHQAMGPQLDCTGFTLILDDIVRPDGTTYMQQLGGGGPQTMFGFQLISQCLGRSAHLGLAAGVGKDLHEESKAWLTAIGVDVSGLIEGQLPTPRAWQLFEEDGRRTQVWRVPECAELYQQLRPRFDELPTHFQSSTHYHLGIHAAHPPMKLLAALRAAAHSRGGLLSVETYTACDTPPPEQDLRALMSVVDIFSPNAAEAESIVGPGQPQELVERLLQLGAKLVALRMGEEGVLLARQPHDGADGAGDMASCCHIPAVPCTKVVDVTGCGNAFCGGFLAGLHAGLNLQESGVWGCVAGSIMAEAQGVPTADIRSLLHVAHAKQQQVLVQMGLSAAATATDEQRVLTTASSSDCVSSQRSSSTALHCLKRPGGVKSMPSLAGCRLTRFSRGSSTCFGRAKARTGMVKLIY